MNNLQGISHREIIHIHVLQPNLSVLVTNKPLLNGMHCYPITSLAHSIKIKMKPEAVVI